jgi:hypothetical protein
MRTFISFLIVFVVDYGIDPIIIYYLNIAIDFSKDVANEFLKGGELASSFSLPDTNLYQKESDIDNNKFRKDIPSYSTLEKNRKPIPYDYVENIYLYVILFVVIEVLFIKAS